MYVYIYIYVVEREKSCVLKDEHSVQGRECFFLKNNSFTFYRFFDPSSHISYFVFYYPLFHPGSQQLYTINTKEYLQYHNIYIDIKIYINN